MITIKEQVMGLAMQGALLKLRQYAVIFLRSDGKWRYAACSEEILPEFIAALFATQVVEIDIRDITKTYYEES